MDPNSVLMYVTFTNGVSYTNKYYVKNGMMKIICKQANRHGVIGYISWDRLRVEAIKASFIQNQNVRET